MKKQSRKNSFINRKLHNLKVRWKWFKVATHLRINSFREISFVKKSTNTWVTLMIPYFILMIVLIVAPILILLLYSLIRATNDALILDFTLKNFKDFFREHSFLATLGRSLMYATVSTFFAVIIGYPVAYLMAFSKSKWAAKNIWILVTLPIWINMLVKVIGFRTLFQLLERLTRVTLIGTPGAVMVGMVYMFLPFVIIPIYNSLNKMDRSWIEASQDLGASPTKTFWKITFRYSMPGIITGVILMLLQATTSLLVVKYMGDEKVTLITSIIESYFLQGSNFGLASAISIFLAIIIFFLVVLLRLLGRRIYGKVGRSQSD